ncbi:MAG: TetR/AcrR family transcriptional regulator [bacterium]|jgi:AcrR family transcriptional regulator
MKEPNEFVDAETGAEMNDDTVSSKKDYRRQRIKKYFLEAVKEIIKKEGVENVTVRKVADMAGYTYPTLYHYFADLNALLWEVKEAMILELIEILRLEMQPTKHGIDGIKESFRTYIAYYFRNPNVFKFFYFHSLNRPTEGAGTEPDYGAMWDDTFREMVVAGKLRTEEIEVVAKTIIYAIHGMITISFSNNGDLTEANVYRDLEKILNYLLDK